jgi:hypothetical protein
MGYAKMSDFRVWHFFCYINDVVPNTMSFRAQQSEAKNLDNIVDASEILPPFGRLDDNK